MTAVSYVLLRLTTFVTLQSILLNVTFVEILEECLLKYVMTETSLTELDVLLTVCQFFLLGFAQEVIVLRMMSVSQNMEMALLLATSNVMITTQ